MVVGIPRPPPPQSPPQPPPSPHLPPALPDTIYTNSFFAIAQEAHGGNEVVDAAFAATRCAILTPSALDVQSEVVSAAGALLDLSTTTCDPSTAQIVTCTLLRGDRDVVESWTRWVPTVTLPETTDLCAPLQIVRFPLRLY